MSLNCKRVMTFEKYFNRRCLVDEFLKSIDISFCDGNHSNFCLIFEKNLIIQFKGITKKVIAKTFHLQNGNQIKNERKHEKNETFQTPEPPVSKLLPTLFSRTSFFLRNCAAYLCLNLFYRKTVITYRKRTFLLNPDFPCGIGQNLIWFL